MSPPSLSRAGIAAAATLALVASSLAPTLAPGAAAHHIDPCESAEGWRVRTLVEANVTDNYATVRVTADIREQGPDPQFPFAVRVPADAYVTGLEITRDGKTYEGEIREREAARDAYEEHRDDHETAGLVEARDRTVYRYLVNVEEATDVRATLTYETYLSASNGTYTLPLEAPVSACGEDAGASFDVTVRHADGVRDAWGAPAADAEQADEGWHLSRSVGPRHGEDATEFRAHYTLEETPDGGSIVSTVENGTGYFAHRFRATPDAREIPLDMALALDTSGSMSGEKISQLRDAARSLVAHLDEGDRLRLVPFASEAHPRWSGFRAADPATRQEATDEVGAFVASGSTNIEAAIEAGFRGYDQDPRNASDEALGVLVFLTDGQATEGTTSNDDLRDQARRLNDDARVFGIAFGSDADWGLVHGLAQDGGGTAEHVPAGSGAEVDLRRFMRSLTSPVLRDISVRYDGLVEAYHPTAPVLFGGSELLVVGTYQAPTEEISGEVTARGPDGPVNRSFRHATGGNASAGFLPDLVAYHRIRALEDRIDAAGETPELVDRVRSLALEHGFVTDYTSLVVTLPEREDQGVCEDCPHGEEQPAEDAAHAPTRSGSGSTVHDPSGAPGGGDPDARDPATHDDPAPATDGVPAAGAGLVAAAAAGAALARGRRD